jgi:hypothetical protein
MQNLTEGLTEDQQQLMDDVFVLGAGKDLRDVLAGMNWPAEDKAAVAEKLGEPGAGEEFQP